MKQSGNTILITGGSSGIGAALAQRFHDQGNVVIVAARRVEALEEVIAGRENMHARQLDVEAPKAVERFARDLLSDFPKLNMLVNNAGIMRFEDASAKRDLADAGATITTNLLGPIRLIDAFIDHLVAADDAAIVNVTSGLAFVPLVTTPTYNATKAALHSYTVALRELLEGKVELIELAPPGVRTDLTPGQSDRTAYLGLDEFIDETMALFAEQPTPSEILVERVRPFRNAEASGDYAAVVKQLNDFARRAREAADA